MKLIKPSYKVVTPRDGSTLLKDIEKIARICYQSEGNIESKDLEQIGNGGRKEVIKDGYPVSAITLIGKLIKRDHSAMLEFGHNIILEVPFVDAQHLMILNDSTSITNMGTKFIEFTYCQDKNRTLISASVRAYRELINSNTSSVTVMRIANTLHRNYGKVLFDRYFDIKNKPYKEIKLKELSKTEKIHHQTETVEFICDRGVTHELVRHRVASFAQESTRYCSYADEVTFIIPECINLVACTIVSPKDNKGNYVHHVNGIEQIANDNINHDWLNALAMCEHIYKDLLLSSWSPQQARSVLPNSIKTQIAVKANLKEWYHIFKLRTPKGAHPQMREVMISLLNDFQYKHKQLFDSIGGDV